MTPTEATISEAGAALRAGDLTAAALLEAHLDLIGRRDPAILSVVHLMAERAWQAARQADADFAAGRDRGPLQGIPFAIKDLIDLDGAVVTFGARRHAGRVATATAPAIQRLLDAGAVPLGIVASYEWALVGPAGDGAYPPARNPWNTDHITGGSSSGSAAAVAAGLVRFAIGTDTGGSIRSPAAYCGIVGLKPTFGAVSTQGVQPLSPSLDHVGPLARTVAEARQVLSVLTGAPLPPLPRDLAGLRVGHARDWADAPEAAPGVLAATDDAVSVLTLCGASAALVGLPDIALSEAAGAVILHAEALALHRDRVGGRGADIGRMAYQSLIAGALLTPDDVALARRQALALRAGIDAALDRCDVLVMPTTLTPAPPFSAFAAGAAVWTPMRTLPFNVTGHPALSVPMGFADGLPLGLQIVGRHGDEATVLRVGAAFEAATDHGVQRPYRD